MKKLSLYLAALTVIGLVLFFATKNYEGLHQYLKTAILQEDLLVITNQEREDNDLPPLIVNELLTQAAQAKANDMAAKGYFAHTSPEGYPFTYWIDQAGYDYLYSGENVAVKFKTAEALSEAWMNSTKHRANILGERFTEIGFGIADGEYQDKTVTFVVAMFGQPTISEAEIERYHLKTVSQGTWKTEDEAENFLAVKKIPAPDPDYIKSVAVPQVLLKFLPLF